MLASNSWFARAVFAAVIGMSLASAVLAEAPYEVAWSRQIGTGGDDRGHSVAVDAAGNVYISGMTCGNLFGPNAGRDDAFLAKYDPSGKVLWSKQVGTASSDVSYSVAVDTGGNVYMSGRTFGSLGGPNAGSGDAFLAKYDASGKALWSRQIGSLENDESHSVTVDAAGNVYIGGFTEGSLGGPSAGKTDAFLAKYDASGNLLWTRQMGTPSYDYGYSVALDACGNAYIGGYTQGSLKGNAASSDAFLAKYDPSGKMLWFRRTVTGWNLSVAVDAASNVYIAGETLTSSKYIGTYFDSFLTKVDASGKVLWSRRIGASNNNESHAVAVDAAGNAYMSGSNFDKQGGQYMDAFLTKFDPSGKVLWSRQVGTPELDESRSVAVDAAGNVYISGDTDGSLGGPNAGGSDVFLIKFAAPKPAPKVEQPSSDAAKK